MFCAHGKCVDVTAYYDCPWTRLKMALRVETENLKRVNMELEKAYQAIGELMEK
jgi:hypothetical protein